MSELALKLIAENKARHARGEDASYLNLGGCSLGRLPNLSDMAWLKTLVLSDGWLDFDNDRWIESRMILHNVNLLSDISDGSLPTGLRILCAGGSHSFKWEISNLDFLKNLTDLERLDLRYTGIRNWDFLKNLTNLQTLDLTGNYINNGDFLKNLTNLQILNLSNNLISDGRGVKNLTNLQILNLSNNLISDGGFLKNLTNLQRLSIYKNKITNGDFLKNLTNLQSLNLSNNQINSIDFLKNLTNLQSLNLSNNLISTVDEIDLPNLEILSFYSNKITNISVEKLKNLKTIDLDYNKITSISFENLLNLNKISAKHNDITHINLNNSTNIKSINLGYNKITSLEPFIYLIQKSIQVELSEYGAMNKEEYINLNHNPIKHPAIEIVAQGNAAILQYFSERSKQQFKNTQIKLILLGNSTAGKTSLSRYLRESIFEIGQSTTEGIVGTEKWNPPGREMQVNIWDFGGQEYYHATHRLFLSRNAVYALVWDAKTDKGGIEPTEIYYENDSQAYTVPLEHFSKAWWLKNIHFNLNKYARHEREGEAPIPILLVQNKCAAGEGYEMQDVPNEFGDTPYHLPAKWRNNHIDLAEATSEQANGEQGEWTMRFKLFETELLKTLESQMATYEFAVYHRDIRDRVRVLASGETPVNEMSWTDFEAMCRDIESDAKMDLVQIYLRDITGDVLYFDQNERLRHRVFLRPDWVCNRIYAILSRKVMEREGLFDLAWMCEALQCDNQEALDFVELMREFQLVFAENDENGEPTGTYVAPQYLPDACTKPDKLEAAKEYANLTHAFTLWFPDFLPKSHIARFVAHWGDKAKQRLFWKNGLLFQTDGCTALVQRKEEFKIQVDIQTGDHAKREDAMSRIFQSFLDLEDGQAGFVISLNETDFVRWRDAQEAIYTQARQVKAFPLEASKYIDIHPFFVFQKPIAMAKKLFISYSHKDEEAMKELDKFLGPLERKGEIEIWTDRKILPGQKWKDEILKALNSADLTLLLVSANFLDSDFINDEEIPRAFQRREAEGTHVVPIILNYCFWDSTDISTLQAIPKDGRPIADYPNPAQGWNEVARAISALLKT
ncbi:MAG: leucine-rich repeat domain-containing protein [Saprospiraceae bacterium]|nr:leucine-rich repeat domain-containing protein [Saprospiraceae bacterium]